MPRLSAGVVIVSGTAPDFCYLLLRAYRYWDFPKGAVEPNEEPLAAARREVLEETGLTELEFSWGIDFLETEPYAGGKVARYYIARTAKQDIVLGINPLLGQAEHHEYRWADYATARDLLNPRVRRILEWAREHIGAKT